MLPGRRRDPEGGSLPGPLKRPMRLLGRLIALALGLVVLMVTGVVVFYAVPVVRCAVAGGGDTHPGSSYHALISGGHRRCYLLYVPSSYPPDRPAPVVLSLHGFMSDPYDQRHYARWERLAEANGFLVVYPQGSSFPLRWNVGPGARIDDVDDVQFIEDLLDDLDAHAAVDPQRIFVTGFSNGGEKTSQIGCALSGRIAAIGVVSGMGPDFPGGCHPARPLPVIAFFGTREWTAEEPMWGIPVWLQDLVFNVSVEAMLPGPDSPSAWVAAWAERDGCQPEPIQLDVSPHVTAAHYAGCGGEAEVVLYTIQGGGHAWPGGPSIPIPGLGESTTEVDASATMWAFFQAHPLPSVP